MSWYEYSKKENCFSGAHVYEYRLATKLNTELLGHLARIGNYKCHSNFPRPFFQLILPDGTSCKGVLNDNIIKVSFPDLEPEKSKNNFDLLLTEILQQYLINDQNT